MQYNDGLDDQTRNKIIGLLKVLFPQGKIYLFGSRAKGLFAESSDIDVAIDEGQEIASNRIDEAKNMLNETNIPYKIDVVDLHQDERLKKIILKEGIVWWE